MRFLILFVFASLVMVSCSKLEPVRSQEDTFKEGKWRMTKGIWNIHPAIGVDTVYDYYESLAKCLQDNYLEFQDNYQGFQNSGEKCDPSDPDRIPFRWELYNNGNGINFWNAQNTFFNQKAVSAPIISFGEEEFTIEYMDLMKNTVDTLQNDTIIYTYTFRRF